MIMILINILFGRGILVGPGNRNRKSESAIQQRCCQLAEISAKSGYKMWATREKAIGGRFCAGFYGVQTLRGTSLYHAS
jgi:hypothetical protein